MRRAVRDACSATCTAQDIRRVRSYMASATNEQKDMLLPTVYANLDPASIPDKDKMDYDAPLPRAQLCLESLYAIEFTNDIGPDIWPRVWPWVQFLDTYRAPGMPLKARGDFYVDFLMFSGTFADHSETHTLITTTPGVYSMVGKAWPGVFAIDDDGKREIAFNDLRSFLVNKNIATHDTLAELIDGAGGTLQKLARLVVLYIASFAPSPNEALDLMPTYFLLESSSFSQLSTPISVTLRGCTPGNPPGYGYIPQALKHHLLRALVNRAHVSHGQIIALIGGFLIGLFPPALIYYRVVSTLIPALRNVFNSYTNNNENSFMKACDNLECAEIGVKDRFKRCSGCKSLYYCSPECQAFDWNTGGHRTACRLYGTYTSMHDFPGQTVLTVYDYSQGRGKISVQHLNNMKDYLHGAEWAISSPARWPAAAHQEMRCWVIPLRTSTCTVYDGLQRLANEFTGDTQTWDWDRLADGLVPLILNDELAIH
ncbi:hypothetical protein B0H13DRAFT_2442567 [Mycena leptocephala]|nr:hypothetical protein B0H13DRAFT_2442567 [Mycena leptocephala]